MGFVAWRLRPNTFKPLCYGQRQGGRYAEHQDRRLRYDRRFACFLHQPARQTHIQGGRHTHPQGGEQQLPEGAGEVSDKDSLRFDNPPHYWRHLCNGRNQLCFKRKTILFR